MPQNRFFRPAARLARKNGSGNQQPAAWQTDSEILTFERAGKAASEGEKRPLSGSGKPLGRRRLSFRKAATRFSGTPHKQSASTGQAFRADRACMADGRSLHGGRTELARWTDGACTVDAPNMPQAPQRPLFRVFCRKPVSAESVQSRLSASFLPILLTIGQTVKGKRPREKGCVERMETEHCNMESGLVNQPTFHGGRSTDVAGQRQASRTGRGVQRKSLSTCCSFWRVKKMRLFTVPRGRSSFSAISRYLKPEMCMEKGILYSRGRALTTRCISLRS